MTRVLHVLAEIECGGAERVVLQLAAAGPARGAEVVVSASPGSWQQRLEDVGAAFFPIGLRPRRLTATVSAGISVASLLRRLHPTVVHAHNVRATVAARLGMAIGRWPAALVATIHGLDETDISPGARILRRSGAHLVACSPGVAEALTGAGVPAQRVRLIANGVTAAPADPNQVARLRHELALTGEPLLVGIGRLHPDKDWPLLIAATRGMRGVQIVVAGDGPLRAELESAADRAGAPVRFVGPVDDIPALLQLASCYVSTSRREGLSMALLEALAAGVPTVATSVGGLATVLASDAAVLVPSRAAADVRSALRSVLADPAVARTLSEGGRAAARRWSGDLMAASYYDLYDAVAAGGPP